MKKVPAKAVSLRTLWLDLPTGLSVAWGKDMPMEFSINLMNVADDLDLAKEAGGPIKFVDGLHGRIGLG